MAKWDHEAALPGLDRPQSLLVAAAFSVVAAANGKERNYAGGHPNIRAMLNTYLHAGTFGGCTDLLKLLIGHTAMAELLKSKVGEHLRGHRSGAQADERSQEWSMLRYLLPEALDPVVRQELRYLDALPAWASPE